MGLARVLSRAQIGMESPEVTVEVDVGSGLPTITVVGLPETAVREARDRVRSAILNSGFSFPDSKVTINLAPADLPKEGCRFDLPIAIGVLIASGQLPKERVGDVELVGELALGGELRPVRAVVTAAIAAREADRSLIAPAGNESEAGLVPGMIALTAQRLTEVTAYLRGLEPLNIAQSALRDRDGSRTDLRDVRGQHRAKRALEVAAAGRHNILLVGPPGTGKTLLASRLSGILPPLTREEALEVAAIASVAGRRDVRLSTLPPVAAPHHTASMTAIAGGGTHPRPGDITRAHHGTLFLDELPEFERRALEVLREPMESGRIVISRAAGQCVFPARFQLVATMNPCPCGYVGDPQVLCKCSPPQIERYRRKVSGPLLDRIDLQVEVPRISLKRLRSAEESGEASAVIRDRVVAARRRQLERQGCVNAALGGDDLEANAGLDAAGERLLARACAKLNLSARAVHRVLRMARTIADLDGSEAIGVNHLSEAVGYRER